MSRDLFIDTDSRQFIEGMNNSAVKMHGPFFKGDTETLNLYFFQRTGIIGTPYSYVDKSSSTAKLSWGTPGQSTLLSITGFTAIPTTISVGVTRSQAATSDKSEIQTLSFSGNVINGIFTLITGTTGVTASYIEKGSSYNGAFNSDQSFLVFNTQDVVYAGITGAVSDWNVGTKFTWPTAYAFKYAPYNALMSWSSEGVTSSMKVSFYEKGIKRWDGYGGLVPFGTGTTATPTPNYPDLGQRVVFSEIAGVTAVTAGTSYWHYIGNDAIGNQITDSEIQIRSLAAIKLTQPKIALLKNVEYGNSVIATVKSWNGSDLTGNTYAVTRLKSNQIVFNEYQNNVVGGQVQNASYIFPYYGMFQFIDIFDLRGVTAGNTYHINTERSKDYQYYGIFDGELNSWTDSTTRINLTNSNPINLIGDYIAVSKVTDGRLQFSRYNEQTQEVDPYPISNPYDVFNSSGSPTLGFQFVNLYDLTGVTVGVNYHVNAGRDNLGGGYTDLTWTIFNGLKSENTFLADTSSAITGITSSNSVSTYGETYHITGVNNNLVRLRTYDAVQSKFSDQNYYVSYFPRNGQFQFISLTSLTGVTIGNNYHFNYNRGSSDNYFYKIYAGFCNDDYLGNDTTSQITGITATGVDDYAPTIFNIQVATPVYSFSTVSETTEAIAYNASASDVKSALDKLKVLGSGYTSQSSVGVIKTLTGSFLISIVGNRANKPFPLFTAESQLLAAPGLTATVGITNAAITTLLSGTTSAPVTLEVELTSGGNKLTAAQGEAILSVPISH